MWGRSGKVRWGVGGGGGSVRRCEIGLKILGFPHFGTVWAYVRLILSYLYKAKSSFNDKSLAI